MHKRLKREVITGSALVIVEEGFAGDPPCEVRVCHRFDCCPCWVKGLPTITYHMHCSGDAVSLADVRDLASVESDHSVVFCPDCYSPDDIEKIGDDDETATD